MARPLVTSPCHFSSVKISEKAFTISVNGGIIKKTAITKSIKDFNALADALDKVYGIKLSQSIVTLDFDAVKEALSGVEKVIKEFPDVGTALTEIAKRTAIDGTIAAWSVYDKLYLYSPAFDNVAQLRTDLQIESLLHHHTPNRTIAGIGAHEAGHGFERALIRASKKYKTPFEEKLAWSNCTEARQIVDKACDNLIKKGQPQAAIIRNISDYADIDASEALAEAFADVFDNGKKANPLSIEIKKVAKKTMKAYKKR